MLDYRREVGKRVFSRSVRLRNASCVYPIFYGITNVSIVPHDFAELGTRSDSARLKRHQGDKSIGKAIDQHLFLVTNVFCFTNCLNDYYYIFETIKR